jgi:predicted unusual protein kinase regulating ubiquinone biosynthesis (AarF/ABC1/UbiB family)
LEVQLAEEQADYETEREQVTEEKAALTAQLEASDGKSADLREEQETLQHRLQEIKTALDAEKRERARNQKRLLEIESLEQRLAQEGEHWQKAEGLLAEGRLGEAKDLLSEIDSKDSRDKNHSVKSPSIREETEMRTRTAGDRRIAKSTQYLQEPLRTSSMSEGEGLNVSVAITGALTLVFIILGLFGEPAFFILAFVLGGFTLLARLGS